MIRRPVIADYMATDLLTLDPDMEINRAVRLLLDRNFSGAPVVDAHRKLVGVLSMKDCLRAAFTASYYQEWGGLVRDYMNAPAKTLDAELELVDAVRIFLDSEYRRFPVVRDGVLVGQLSRADLLRAMAQEWGGKPTG